MASLATEALRSALSLSLAYWLTAGALYACCVAMVLCWLARWGDDVDRRGE